MATSARSAITPGESHRNALDYADQTDAKFYKMMIKSPDTKFDGKGENLRAFMERITERVDEGGMHGIFNSIYKKKDATGGGNITPQKSYSERLKYEKNNSPWKFEAPGKRESWSKKIECQTYHWCSKHGKWVTTHKDSDNRRM
jgi:hypothetical protein